jgi:hypothetical protein
MDLMLPSLCRGFACLPAEARGRIARFAHYAPSARSFRTAEEQEDIGFLYSDKNFEVPEGVYLNNEWEDFDTYVLKRGPSFWQHEEQFAHAFVEQDLYFHPLQGVYLRENVWTPGRTYAFFGPFQGPLGREQTRRHERLLKQSAPYRAAWEQRRDRIWREIHEREVS